MNFLAPLGKELKGYPIDAAVYKEAGREKRICRKRYVRRHRKRESKSYLMQAPG
jgi:hypothetical protein